MNREQRRQAERKGRKELAARAGLSEFEVQVISAAVGVLGRAADDLEAGHLSPADFIDGVRALQAQFASDPARALARLAVTFSDPVLARMELALATGERMPGIEAESNPAQDKQSCAGPAGSAKAGE